MKLTTAISILLIIMMTGCSDDHPGLSSEVLLKAQRWNDPGIYDARGRYMLMRGVNLNTLGDYWEANPEIPAVAPYEPDHFRLMASYGFNVVRLLFHWSAVEPVRGQYDYGYIDRIRQAVDDAAEHGVYVMLDMHQDAYSKYVATPAEEQCESPGKGWDGAPEWATLTDGASTCTDGGRRESAPAAYNSWRNFWNNTDGIRDACIAAWQEVVKATAYSEYVLGYDALNEPALGNGELGDQLNKYSNFLKALVRGIREAESEAGAPEHIFFFETTVGWNGEQIPSTPDFNFTMDENIVFAPHNYFEVIGPPVLTIEQGAALYDNLAGLYGTHSLVGEWGVFGNPATDTDKLKRFAAAEDAYFMGSTWWQWCQAPGDPHGISWDGTSYSTTSFHLLQVAADGSYTGERNTAFLQILGRARPVAMHGQPVELVSDPDTGSMLLRAKASSKGETTLWVPGHFGVPVVTGSNVMDVNIEPVDGGYSVSVIVDGSYIIEVGY